MENLAHIKEHLLRQKTLTEIKLLAMEKKEEGQEAGQEIELGSLSWQEHAIQTRHAIKERLAELYQQINKALKRLKEGTYGICEQCGREIEMARLKIMPTTTFCISCK